MASESLCVQPSWFSATASGWCRPQLMMTSVDNVALLIIATVAALVLSTYLYERARRLRPGDIFS
ncbi:hypothetical protein EXIGLDRAFT_759835 [Exidia glandulosa HHB12029]|uniref:Uncharacterized protein n=1 Tax=Exidia glandulosa HHB12029 TaxID=1314781 RepID=A0A165PVP3_EXIGL|nr:hypothetical protein EXIGLDRAFT_759835 [Exidia glandulosa HHB12029]